MTSLIMQMPWSIWPNKSWIQKIPNDLTWELIANTNGLEKQNINKNNEVALIMCNLIWISLDIWSTRIIKHLISTYMNI